MLNNLLGWNKKLIYHCFVATFFSKKNKRIKKTSFKIMFANFKLSF